MVSEVAVRVESLSKSYIVGHDVSELGYTTFRDAVAKRIRSLARKSADLMRGRQIVEGDEIEEFWALRDISFEVGRGEALGIVGRNGAGKSTLLKILSRITEPTSGRVRIAGRVASLLEVGTGFHPELSGRENVFLNGAILGMTRAEIRRKFDEIVQFAGVERFIDTPVKRYSSGMYVRLAFSVAAHLETEIMIIDEVLAVGDQEFQSRCLQKMESVGRESGRTVLFVSHNLAAVEKLCQKAIWIDRGRIAGMGEAPSVVRSYIREAQSNVKGVNSWTFPRRNDDSTQVLRVNVRPYDTRTDLISPATETLIGVTYCRTEAHPDLDLTIEITDPIGTIIFTSSPADSGLALPKHTGAYAVEVKIPAQVLLPRVYGIHVVLWSPSEGDLEVREGIYFSVASVGARTLAAHDRAGVVQIQCDWALRQVDEPEAAALEAKELGVG